MAINETITKYKELQNFIKQLEDEADTLKQAIIEEMNARQVDTINTDLLRATYKAVTSSRVDTTALKKELPEVAERFTKSTTSKRFTVS